MFSLQNLNFKAAAKPELVLAAEDCHGLSLILLWAFAQRHIQQLQKNAAFKGSLLEAV